MDEPEKRQCRFGAGVPGNRQCTNVARPGQRMCPRHKRLFKQWAGEIRNQWQKSNVTGRPYAGGPRCSRPGCFHPRALGEDFCPGCQEEGFASSTES